MRFSNKKCKKTKARLKIPGLILHIINLTANDVKIYSI